MNSGGAVNALSHFEFCVPNAVCAPPGSKQAVSSRPFWPHHADFQHIRPQNRVGTSKSLVPPFGAKSNAFREKCKMPCKITGRASGPPGRVPAFVPAPNFPAGEKITPKFKNLVVLIRFLRVRISSKENPTMNEQPFSKTGWQRRSTRCWRPIPIP